MKHDKYYQGILQLRNVPKEIIDYVLDRFESQKVGIAKIVKLKTGIDIYSASNKFSKKIAHYLYKNYGGEIKENPKLFSRDSQTGKNIYRMNILFRCPDYLPGEVIKVNDQIIKISSLSTDILKGTNLSTMKRTAVKLGKRPKVEKVPVFETQVIKSRPNVEIMDPETYQSVEVSNSVKCKSGDLVKVAKDDNQFYVVP